MKRTLWPLVWFVIASLPLFGCEQTILPEISKQSDKIDELGKVLAQQRDEMAALRKAVAELDEANASIRNELNLFAKSLTPFISDLKELKEKNKTVVFDPSEKSYQMLATGHGVFAVSLGDVKPHADGVKVKLHIGNLTSAAFRGAKFKIEYGAREIPVELTGKGVEDFLNWQATLKEKEVNFTETLRPGFWNNVVLSLPGIQPQKFGYIRLSMRTDEIVLQKAAGG